MESSRVEWIRVEWTEEEWSGAERSGVECCYLRENFRKYLFFFSSVCPGINQILF